MGVGAERPKTWGGSSQKLGRIDLVWGGRGAYRPGADRLWGSVSRSVPSHFQVSKQYSFLFFIGNMADCDRCKLLDEDSTKTLIDSVDTILIDCDGIIRFCCFYCFTDSLECEKQHPVLQSFSEQLLSSRGVARTTKVMVMVWG